MFVIYFEIDIFR